MKLLLAGPKFRMKTDRLLLLLALKGPCNKAEMEKQLRIDHPTIHKIVNDLASRHAIRSYPTSNPIVKRYDLAVLGLAELITHLERKELDKTIDRLADKYASLMPGILDLWPMIKEVGAQDIARGLLRKRCEYILVLSKPENMKVTLIGGLPAEINTIMQEVVHDFWDACNIHHADLESTWLRKISKNATLRQMAVDETLRCAEAEVRARNRILRQLSSPELALGEPQEVKTLAEELEDLKFALRMLQDQSGLKVVMPKKEESGDPKT